MDALVRQQQQVYELNRNPLNQEAKSFLKQAGVDVDPSFQHLYQLLLWGVNEQGLSFIQKKWAADYLPFLEKLAFQLDQEQAYRYLVDNPESNDPADALLQEGDLARRDSPLDAAAQLLEVFQNALTLDENLVPSFPPNTPLE